jgi:hypothetical protein
MTAPTICLLLITDGRADYFDRCTNSARECLPVFDQRIVVDDSAHELGFAGAIQHGWDRVETDYVFHLEDDFTFNARIPVHEMIGLLRRHDHLVQIALKRQAWNEKEKAAGGIVELHPNDFLQQHDGRAVWTEHRRFFTTNPSVYSADLCKLGWPQVPHSEGIFTHQLLDADPKAKFAFWGGKYDPPLVHHIGEHRAGNGY